MSLDALAPDQRAVVQLVLQQDRSYEDLAALLGITPEAVRERAHRGLERLSAADAVDAGDRAEIADYLLGQQSVSGREATRGLLHRSEAGRLWALAVAEELAGVARSPLPEVPGGPAAVAATPAEPEPVTPITSFDDPVEPEPEVVADEEPTPTRARPRPRREPTPAPDFGFDDEPEPDRAEPATAGADRTSRLGGALLIAGVAILVAAIIVFLVTRGSDDKDSTSTTSATTPSDTATAAPSATATPSFQEIAELGLKSASGASASGKLIVFAAQNGQATQVAFNIKASKVPPNASGQAYGVWLVGGKDHFLGYAGTVGKDGKLAVSGPRAQDQKNFAKWLASSKQFVVSTETQDGASSPGPLVLEGNIADAKTAATATPTP